MPSDLMVTAVNRVIEMGGGIALADRGLFPVLDGGRLVFIVIRKITGKMITDRMEDAVNIGAPLDVAVPCFRRVNRVVQHIHHKRRNQLALPCGYRSNHRNRVGFLLHLRLRANGYRIPGFALSNRVGTVHPRVHELSLSLDQALDTDFERSGRARTEASRPLRSVNSSAPNAVGIREHKEAVCA